MANAYYCLNWIFFQSNYDAARLHLKEALSLDQNNWVIWANLATTSCLMNELDLGITELKKAINLKGSKIGIDNEKQIPRLRDALEKVGLRIDTFYEVDQTRFK